MDGVDAPPPPPDFALSPQDPGGPPSAIDPGPLEDPLVEPAPVAMPVGRIWFPPQQSPSMAPCLLVNSACLYAAGGQ